MSADSVVGGHLERQFLNTSTVCVNIYERSLGLLWKRFEIARGSRLPPAEQVLQSSLQTHLLALQQEIEVRTAVRRVNGSSVQEIADEHF